MFEKNFKCYNYLCHKGKLMINNLINLCLITSDEEFELQGHSYEDVVFSRGLTWMIYKWKFSFNREIEQDEDIKIQTWASGFDKLYSYREYRVYDKKDNLLAKAAGVFLIIDVKRKKPIRLPKDITDLYQLHDEKNFDEIERIKNEKNISKIENFKVRKSDIDKNNHVNNSVYFRWIFNSIPEKFLSDKFISEINLVYNREVKFGSNVDIYSNEDYSHFEIKTDITHSKADIKYKCLNK